MIMILLSLILIIFMFTIFMMLMKKMNFNKNKSSPFECGFESFSTARIPFSMRFFKITLIFLIFDIEIIIMLPSPIMMKNSFLFHLSFSMIMTMIIFGLMYEWKKGSLNWIK